MWKARLRWFGHVKRSTNAPVRRCKLTVIGLIRDRSRPRKSCGEVIRYDMACLQFAEDMTLDGKTWRSSRAILISLCPAGELGSILEHLVCSLFYLSVSLLFLMLRLYYYWCFLNLGYFYYFVVTTSLSTIFPLYLLFWYLPNLFCEKTSLEPMINQKQPFYLPQGQNYSYAENWYHKIPFLPTHPCEAKN